MTTLAVVQARMGSTRLPGKVALPIDGRPALVLLLERIRGAADHLVVATSTAPADDEVVALATSAGVEVVRGPEDDVLARFRIAHEAHPAETIVRLTADCPLSDPALVCEAVAAHEARGADYTSNTLIRTYPDGLDVEVLRAEALLAADAEARDPIEREHVTPFVVRRPERFALAAFRTDQLLGDRRWTIDTPVDLERLRHMVSAVDEPVPAPWTTFIDVDEYDPASPSELRLRPAILADSEFLLALRNEPASLPFRLTPDDVDPQDHARWFRAVLTTPTERVWIAELGQQRIGQVRTKVACGEGTVSIDVHPSHRGKAYAVPMLRALQRAISADYQIHTMIAMVHSRNAPSRAAFRRAGFLETATETERFHQYRWVRP